MRPLLALLLLPLLASPIFAQEPSPPQSTRQTWEQHFTQADLAHDGHLTREEAKGGYALVAKHFDEIDVDHKGYLTTNDIRTWRIGRKAARHQAKPPTERVKPLHAHQPRLQPPLSVFSLQPDALAHL
jgi:hypothetical protein